MGKRGRKPNPDKKTGYFYEEEEQAFVDYINATSKIDKEKIFNDKLLIPFTKMIQSIIRRYKLYTPDEDFNEIFDDTLSFLLTKISNFDVTTGKKAYSYCGTICKNYLIYKINQFIKNQKRNESYEDNAGSINDNIELSYNNIESDETFNSDLISETIGQIQEMLLPENINTLTDNEAKIGYALVDLLTSWEFLFEKMGSNKFNKSSVLFFIKEETRLSTKEIRDSLKKYKFLYFQTKNEMLS